MRAFATRGQKARERLDRLNEEGWLYGGLPGLQWEAENARRADRELMRSIRDDMASHAAFHDYYRSCINCGNCTAASLMIATRPPGLFCAGQTSQHA